MPKLDLRKTLREIANAIQDDNLDRLLAGRTLDGGSVAPRVVTAEEASGRKKRVRIFGIRVSLRDLAGKVGVKSGEMLRDVTRRANVKMGRTSFKIIPNPSVIRKWFAFQSGTKHQTERPTSGISDTRLEEAHTAITVDSRNQFVRNLQNREAE